MASGAKKSEPMKSAVSVERAVPKSAPGTITPETGVEEAVDVLCRNALRELEDEDHEDPEAAEVPLSEADRERVRAFIRDGFRLGMSRDEAAELQEAAVQDLLRALEFGMAGHLDALLEAVRGLGEVVVQVREARRSATAGS